MTRPEKMQWHEDAQRKLGKVPFFLRSTVRKMAEEYARARGGEAIDAALLDKARDEYFGKIARAGGSPESGKLYVLDACRGCDLGCPYALRKASALAEELAAVLEGSPYLKNLKGSLDDLMLPHHRFQVSLSSCPNACSQPQIRDFGLHAVCLPAVSGEKCSRCRRCVDACRESAVALSEAGPSIENDKCIGCGSCHRVCPTGALAVREEGFAVLVGGKLGRHPRLATRLPGVFDEKAIPAVLARCLDVMAQRKLWGKRLGELLEKEPALLDDLAAAAGEYLGPSGGERAAPIEKH